MELFDTAPTLTKQEAIACLEYMKSLHLDAIARAKRNRRNSRAMKATIINGYERSFVALHMAVLELRK